MKHPSPSPGPSRPPDRDRVRLTIPGLVPGSVVYLRMDPVSDEGEPMWSTLAWYTLNQIPRE